MKPYAKLCCPPRLSGYVPALQNELMRHLALKEGMVEDGDLCIVVLDSRITESELYDAFPWLKEQFAHSSFRFLRLMPFVIYSSETMDIESFPDSVGGQTLEAVFSGEFKPYGYDISAPNPLAEFDGVLQGYLE